MSFNLELPDVEEVKEKVAEELAVTDERQQTVDETAKQKVEEIMGTDISVFEDRKNLTTAFEEFGADVMRKTENKNSILSKRMGELSKAQAIGDFMILAERGRRCLHLHLPDNSTTTLQRLSDISAEVLMDLQ